MQTDASIGAIAHVIQLSVTPVFLILSIGSLLGVLTSRLGRIIDRARRLESSHDDATGEHRVGIGAELRTLSRRARLINLAISLSTTAALLVCVTIVCLFLGAVTDHDVSKVVAMLFIVAMLALVTALLNFLREVWLATASLRIGPR